MLLGQEPVVHIFSLSNMLVMYDASSTPHGLLEVE